MKYEATRSRLKRYSELIGVAGREESVARALSQDLNGLVDEIRTDVMGNLIAHKRGSGSGRRLMIAAHMDEIGLVVTGIEGSFLRFARIGGVNPRLLPGAEVTVHIQRSSGEEPRNYPGIIGTRPPHLIPPEDRKKPFETEDLFIDVGLEARELRNSVSVGDWISFRQTAIPLGASIFTGKALDNRVSLAVMVAALEVLQTMSHRWDIYAVATVQEEVGLRGVTTSSFGIDPQIGIALDVTFAEQSGLSSPETVKWDRGPAIGIGPNLHPGLRRLLVERAEAEEIPYVDEVLPGNTGTDAWSLQVTRAGVPTALLSVPIRCMHSAVEMVRLRDVERTARLLACFIARLEDKAL